MSIATVRANNKIIQKLKVFIQEPMLVKIALIIVGGLSRPSKMPGYGWSIPASLCKRGSLLRKIKGSVCHNCYACKGRYLFGVVKDCLHNRLNKFYDPLWVNAMIRLTRDKSYFRWFDSGDLQSVDMLEKICLVCANSPNCNHWLPTREFAIIKQFLKKGNTVPSNLCIRLSADMVDEYPKHSFDGIPFSTVSTNLNTFKHNKYPKVLNCGVTVNKNIKKCKELNCTACWDNKVKHINYLKH